MFNTIDFQQSDKDGAVYVKNATLIGTDSKTKQKIYEADTHGDIAKLEYIIRDETGQNIKLVSRNK